MRSAEQLAGPLSKKLACSLTAGRGNDRSVCAYEHRRRNAIDPERGQDFALGERHSHSDPQRLGSFPDRVGIPLKRERDKLNTTRLELSPNQLQLGQLPSAHHSAGNPDVDHGWLAAKDLGIQGRAVQKLCLEAARKRPIGLRLVVAGNEKQRQ